MRAQTTLSVVVLYFSALIPISPSSLGASAHGIPLPHTAEARPGFTRMLPDRTGLSFTNDLADERSITNRNLLSGSGVALGDVDGDGWCDIYLCGLDSTNRLYRNLGDWRFEDITGPEIACSGQDSTGATLADLDGDGDLDLLVNSFGNGTRIFENDGTGKFSEKTGPAGLASKTGSTSFALADIDGDGDLDLYVANFRTTTLKDQPTTNFRVQYQGQEPLITHVDGRPATLPHLTNRFILSASGQVLELGEADVLYLNEGGMRFKPAGFTSGRFRNESGEPLREPPYDWGLAALFYDFNGDLAPDLYVCNDLFTPDRIWINDGAGNFNALPWLSLRNTSTFSMGVDFGDLNRDGHPDFFVVDMLSREHAKRHVQVGEMAPFFNPPGQIENRPQIPQNTLQLNRGDGTFAEISHYAGVEASEWSWGPIFLDVDLDGWEDILVSNGQLRDFQNADIARRIEGIKARQQLSHAEVLKLLDMFPGLRDHKMLFWNQRDLTFREVGETWGLNDHEISQGMALGDLDNDGDLDLVINNLNSAASLYRNNAAAPRVAVRLAGKAPNTAGVGAKIRVLGGPVPQSQEMIAGGRYLSGDQALRVFAAGTNNGPLTIEVTWRDGTQTTVTNARANHLYTVPQADAVRLPQKTDASPQPMFEDVSHLIAHRHTDEFLDDLQRQPLLPMRLAQLGPGVAWHDFDGDGWEDLILPSGRSGQLAVLRNNTRGGFTNLSLPMLQRPLQRDQTTPLALGHTLFIGSSNYEDGMTNGGAIRIYDLQRGAAGESLLGPKAATGPMAMADIDGDGALDLFVGGRAVAGRYPEPATSTLYRNEAMSFVEAQRFENLGLVSGAVFSDLDGDGDPDLVLACHWGPIRVFTNERGQFTESTQSWGLAEHTGLWNGIATGDLNNDGRPDLIASNWGLNTRWHASRENPLRLYYGDFDANGVIDMVEATYDELLDKEVPIRGLRVVGMALPSVQEKIGTFEAYGKASVREIYGDKLESAKRLEVTTLASTVFINTGSGFEARPLPPEAQFAPAFAVCVGELDGDGNEDVFLSQNFFATNLEMPRSDAGRGLWLRGDGKGNLASMPGQESGVQIYGEQRGAALADYDGDGRTDLVVMQNAGPTKLYRNQGATPGLRVIVQGPPNNPNAVGAAVRLLMPNGHGPLREIQAGSGYWSKNAATQVLGAPPGYSKLWVRSPGGSISIMEITGDGKEMRVRVE